MTTSDWYTVTQIGPGAWEIFEPLGSEGCRSYVIEGERDVAVLDTGEGVGDFAGLVASLSDRNPIVLHSHGHWDHVGASHRFARVLIHPSEADLLREGVPHEELVQAFAAEDMRLADLPVVGDPAQVHIPGVEPTGELNDGDVIDLGGRMLEAFHTPGHSPGGMTLLDRANRLLFPGDAVNTGTIFLHFSGGDPAAWRGTIEKLAELAEHADAIYPTHDVTPIHAADVRAIRDAYAELWSGARQPDERGAGYGDATADLFAYERFTFWLPAGRYGAGAA